MCNVLQEGMKQGSIPESMNTSGVQDGRKYYEEKDGKLEEGWQGGIENEQEGTEAGRYDGRK